MSHNFSRQDFLRFHLNSEYFDYTLNLTHFDQSEETRSRTDVKLLKEKFNGMHQTQTVHRFEVKLFDCFQFIFQEGVMMNTTSSFDFRLLNPFVYFHGFYNFTENPDYNPPSSDEANNYVSVELGYTIVPHLRANLQFLMDQIQLPGEGLDSNGCPQAFGFLFNVEFPWIIKDSYVNFWFETAMIMPYTYLNLKRNGEMYNTNLDMITGYHNANQDEIGYAGYTYGPDSLVFALGSSFGELGSYAFDCSLRYIVHGKYGYGYETIIPERGLEHRNDMPFVGVGLSNAEHRIEASIDGLYYLMEGLELSSGISFIQIFNYKCGDKKLSDLQFKIALSFNPVKMFVH